MNTERRVLKAIRDFAEETDEDVSDGFVEAVGFVAVDAAGLHQKGDDERISSRTAFEKLKSRLRPQQQITDEALQELIDICPPD